MSVDIRTVPHFGNTEKVGPDRMLWSMEFLYKI